MFIISLLLFLGGFALFAVAFMIDFLQPVVFAAGIIAVCLAMALPMHFSKTSR
ncbi:hypothetical protein [Microbacterium paludicola]|jgi:ABC-type uncharacterized transport system permease subunit|uniref:hypothetical protein n=1 Tax=Microbacterium paludicola TaxID=300019 RepID=UPI0014300A39|nr:hypothetical protein [Microbacterium paludicola]MBF0816955.1 hypothetical protein [Microbacterium paludicola]